MRRVYLLTFLQPLRALLLSYARDNAGLLQRLPHHTQVLPGPHFRAAVLHRPCVPVPSAGGQRFVDACEQAHKSDPFPRLRKSSEVSVVALRAAGGYVTRLTRVVSTATCTPPQRTGHKSSSTSASRWRSRESTFSATRASRQILAGLVGRAARRSLRQGPSKLLKPGEGCQQRPAKQQRTTCQTTDRSQARPAPWNAQGNEERR